MAKSSPALFFRSPVFDICFFHISALLTLLLLIPYGIWGAATIIPIYNFYLIFFGLPHNFMTWASVFPKGVRKHIYLPAIIGPAALCLIICLFLPSAEGWNRNLILTVITMASLWHAYRQHHGICKLYDAVQARRTGDTTIFKDRMPMNLFFGFAAWAVVVWAYTKPEIKYLLSADEFYFLLYPQLPEWLFHAYCGVTLCLGIWTVKRSLWDRWRQGKFVPWPQASLMGFALLTYIVPYLFIPLSAMPLAVAIATIYHNIQYFGFVWLFERHRTAELSSLGVEFALPQSLVLRGLWVRYFALAMLYSVLVVGLYLWFPKSIGFVLIYFIAFAHYIVDGFVWKRKYNQHMGSFVADLSKGKPAFG